MSTPRTDEKDKGLKGNFAMCYGVMVEFARGLERELASSESIRHAEKAILIQEIEHSTALRAEVNGLRSEIERLMGALRNISRGENRIKDTVFDWGYGAAPHRAAAADALAGGVGVPPSPTMPEFPETGNAS